MDGLEQVSDMTQTQALSLSHSLTLSLSLSLSLRHDPDVRVAAAASETAPKSVPDESPRQGLRHCPDSARTRGFAPSTSPGRTVPLTGLFPRLVAGRGSRDSGSRQQSRAVAAAGPAAVQDRAAAAAAGLVLPGALGALLAAASYSTICGHVISVARGLRCVTGAALWSGVRSYGGANNSDILGGETKE